MLSRINKLSKTSLNKLEALKIWLDKFIFRISWNDEEINCKVSNKMGKHIQIPVQIKKGKLKYFRTVANKIRITNRHLTLIANTKHKEDIFLS